MSGFKVKSGEKPTAQNRARFGRVKSRPFPSIKNAMHPMLIFAIPPVSARHTRPGFLCKFVTILQAERKPAGTSVQPTNLVESYGPL